jgi:hypothetical protein
MTTARVGPFSGAHAYQTLRSKQTEKQRRAALRRGVQVKAGILRTEAVEISGESEGLELESSGWMSLLKHANG